MRLLQGSSRPSVGYVVALVVLVYAGCLGGVVAFRLARGGRPSYWVSVAGAALFVTGVLFGSGNPLSGLTVAVLAGGLGLAVVGVALDLIFGPPVSVTTDQESEVLERGFE